MPRCGYGAGRPSAHARILAADDAFRLQLLSATFGSGCDAGPATAAAEGSGIYGETCIWSADRAAGAQTQEAKQRRRQRDCMRILRLLRTGHLPPTEPRPNCGCRGNL